MLSRIKNRFLRTPLLLPVLLFALAFRAAIPAGYMPAVADGELRMVMCSGVVLSDTGAPPVSRSAHDASPQCPFAASALPPLSVPETVFTVGVLHAGPINGPRTDSGLVFTPVRAQRARAPPLSRQIQS